MLPSSVDNMLSEYKAVLGRCNSLSVSIKKLKREIEIQKAQAVLNLSGGGQQMDGMPHGNALSQPTERVGIMLATGYEYPGVTELRKLLVESEAEYLDKQMTLLFVEGWLDGLTARERWIIEQQIFEGATYRQLNTMYREKFGEECSKDSLRRLRKTALEKIYEMAK